jgi:hypothetical protein
MLITASMGVDSGNTTDIRKRRLRQPSIYEASRNSSGIDVAKNVRITIML